MGLFSKKNCSICGGEIGFLGNRKLEDGNCCKNCAKKLSPFFDERRHSTVDQIKEQIALREENAEKIKSFTPTLTVGDDYKVYIDEDSQRFIVSRSSKWRDENPDIIEFSQVLGCSLNVSESTDEETFTDKDGNRKSYNPPRITYSYYFDETITLNHPYLTDIEFRIGQCEEKTGGGFHFGGSSTRSSLERMGEEIRQAIMEGRKTARENAQQASMPKVAVQCKCCGASVIPDDNGRCEYCGGSAI